jgi:Protein of unknown function (DUF2975)
MGPSKLFLKILYACAWILFVAVSIEASAFVVSTVGTMTMNPVGAKHLWHLVDLSPLYYYDKGYYLVLAVIICVSGVLKAIILYLIIHLLHSKKIDFSRPFSNVLIRFTHQIAYLSIVTGLVSAWGVKFADRFEKLGLAMPDIEDLRLGGSDVWLFMGFILLVIAQVFKKGNEIQTEHELTV